MIREVVLNRSVEVSVEDIEKGAIVAYVGRNGEVWVLKNDIGANNFGFYDLKEAITTGRIPDVFNCAHGSTYRDVAIRMAMKTGVSVYAFDTVQELLKWASEDG